MQVYYLSGPTFFGRKAMDNLFLYIVCSVTQCNRVEQIE